MLWDYLLLFSLHSFSILEAWYISYYSFNIPSKLTTPNQISSIVVFDLCLGTMDGDHMCIASAKCGAYRDKYMH